MNGAKDIQAVGLDILKKFIRVAGKERLNWFAMFGTLLGAVRHGGFIPWDDDVDIALPRDDYDRLRQGGHWFGYPYFLQTPGNDPAAAARFIRLRRSDTALVDEAPDFFTRGGNMGAYIDIFPLDDVPDGDTAKRMQKTVLGINRQMYASAAMDEYKGARIPEHVKEFCWGAGGFEGVYDTLAERYEALCSKYRGQPYYSILALKGGRGGRVYDKEWFSSSVTMRFEDIDIAAPSGFREVLVASYPKGLREPPKLNQKPKSMDGRIADMSRSYKHYAGRYTGMLDGIKGKKVFIFGAGDSLRIWLERYGHGADVTCVFDNSAAKWGSLACGKPVRNPAELPGCLNEGSRLIIASVYYKEISRQLEAMGISDYYIFIDGLNYREGETNA